MLRGVTIAYDGVNEPGLCELRGKNTAIITVSGVGRKSELLLDLRLDSEASRGVVLLRKLECKKNA